MEYYGLKKLGPSLFVAKYVVILLMAVPWKANQVPAELFNIRKYSNADVSWLLLAAFSSLQKSDELSPRTSQPVG